MTKEEEMLLRQLAAGQCTIQKVVDALGPLSLWSDKALKAEIDEAVEAERERIFGELLKMHEIASSRHNYYLNAVLTIGARGKE
jgi:hypothetical protein